VLFAVLLGILLVAWVVARRLNIFGPNSRTWLITLFGAAVGAVLMVTIMLLTYGVIFSLLKLVVVAFLGVLGGTILTHVSSYFTSLRRRVGN
jgi:hypothetical protein